jgi:hypothetical protein
MDLIDVGPGPWKVFMLVNVDENGATKKQTEIRIHTYPRLITQLKNKRSPGTWVLVLTIRDFEYLPNAFRFYRAWCLRTRGQGPRIARGLCLWKHYGEEYGVYIECLAQTRDEVRDVVSTRLNTQKEHERRTAMYIEGEPLSVRTAMLHKKQRGWTK